MARRVDGANAAPSDIAPHNEKGPRTRFAGLFDAHPEGRAFSDFQAAVRCALMAERVRTIRLNMEFSGSG
jgi:hypothetical protein